MAGAHVQTKGAGTSGATSLGVSLTGVGAGNHLCCHVGTNKTPSAATSSPTATWSNALNPGADGFGVSLRVDYSENVASGSWTVTGNISPSGRMMTCASESSGVKTSASLGSTNDVRTNNAATVHTGSITPTAGSVLYAGCYGSANAGSTAATIDSSFTVREAGGAGTCWDIDGNIDAGGTASLDNAAASATNPLWTGQWNTPTLFDGWIVEFLASGTAVPSVDSWMFPLTQPYPERVSVVSY